MWSIVSPTVCPSCRALLERSQAPLALGRSPNSMWVCALMQRHVSGYLSNIPPIAASRRRGMSPGLAGAPALMLGGRALARFVRGGSGEATTTKTMPSMHASGTLCVQALGMRRPQVVLATLAHGLALVGDGAARMVIDRICARYVRTAVRLKHVLGFPCSTQAALARAFGEREPNAVLAPGRVH